MEIFCNALHVLAKNQLRFENFVILINFALTSYKYIWENLQRKFIFPHSMWVYMKFISFIAMKIIHFLQQFSVSGDMPHFPPRAYLFLLFLKVGVLVHKNISWKTKIYASTNKTPFSFYARAHGYTRVHILKNQWLKQEISIKRYKRNLKFFEGCSNWENF